MIPHLINREKAKQPAQKPKVASRNAKKARMERVI